jgi:HSP20 family protein
MSIIKYNPVRNVSLFPDLMDRFLENPELFLQDTLNVSWCPAVDVSEFEDRYEVEVEVPGMKKEDIKVSFEDGILRLTGEKKQEEKTDKKNFHRIERSYGSFERAFRIPGEVQADAIKARYDNGVLNISIPKAEEAKPRQIEIK